MPGFDRTGPQGAGARTGRGMGRCVGGADPRFGGRPGAAGFGGRGGFGGGGQFAGGGRGIGRAARGFGRRCWAWISGAPVDQESEYLRQELTAARQSLAEMRNRLDELERRGSKPDSKD